jgi:anaerobic selenocysteine-containing dehydrogenase/Fe-S-cluster-containing dehydrogenase component
MDNKLNRRSFIKWSAIGSTTIAATGCGSDPVEELIPLLVPPADYVPGVSVHVATTCQDCSAGCGLIIRTREGRAIKVEGNPQNPLNQGAVCAQGQATLQGLYSPSRIKAPFHRKAGQKNQITWEESIALFNNKIDEVKTAGNKKILYFGKPQTGSLKKLTEDFLSAIGATKLEIDLTPVRSLKKANQICFNRPEIPHYALEKVDLLVNFGADFLETWLNPVQATKNFTQSHQLKNGKKGEFIHISPHMSLTGSNADEWISCPPGKEVMIVLSLVKKLLEESQGLTNEEKKNLKAYIRESNAGEILGKSGIDEKAFNILLSKIRKSKNFLALAGGLTSAGENSLQLQIAVNLLNYVVGSINQSVLFGADYQIGGSSAVDIQLAISDMQAGKVGLLIVENVNPTFVLPQNADFKSALEKVDFVMALVTERDETNEKADLVLPISHFLESWGDAFPRTGLSLLQQPVMAKVPKINSIALGDLWLQIAQLKNLPGFEFSNFREYIKQNWLAIYKASESGFDFKMFWRQSLQNGGLYQDYQIQKVNLSQAYIYYTPAPVKPSTNSLTLIPANSNLRNINAHHSNKSWLAEIPHPITQISWDAWVEIHPETALKLKIKHGDLVQVNSHYGSLKLAAYIYYGVDKNCVSIPTGYGRKVPFPKYKTSRGKSKFLPVLEFGDKIKVTDTKVGENVMEIVPFLPDRVSGDLILNNTIVEIKNTGTKAYVTTADGQYRSDLKDIIKNDPTGFGDRGQKGRGFIRTLSLDDSGQFKVVKHAEAVHQLKERYYTLDREEKTGFYDSLEKNVEKASQSAGKKPDVYFSDYKWEMIIDLDKCTGCSTCVAACYAENNIAVVGKDRMAKGREMSWLRIERYFDFNKTTGQLETYFSPQMCGQCDNAGCEPVCPVYATYQSPDGINSMIYNRCVGTRYCANNCAYKQRRFNWRTYDFPYPLNMQLNPSVTVRSKGVMEKCNFCFQRIREMKDLAKDNDRLILDGEVKTACQQSCPADAITFGNVKDTKSMVHRLKKQDKRGYKQLEEVNYKPAVTYLKKVLHNHKKA